MMTYLSTNLPGPESGEVRVVRVVGSPGLVGGQVRVKVEIGQVILELTAKSHHEVIVSGTKKRLDYLWCSNWQ